jgi:hypothetical protein
MEFSGGIGPIGRLLAADHDRLGGLLDTCVTEEGGVDAEPYEAFRAGLLRHIAVEEKLLFPATRRAHGGAALSVLERLHRDHGALALLLVPTPSADLVGEIRSILETHNATEEGSGGVYAACDALPEDEVRSLLERMRAYPPVKLAPHFDGPGAVRSAAEALRTVGGSGEKPDPRR